jgi:protein CpxP
MPASLLFPLYKTLPRLTDSLPHLFENGVLISIDVRAAPNPAIDQATEITLQGEPMKSTRTRIITIGAAVLLAVAAAIAQGMHGHGGPDGDMHHMMRFFTHYLDLTTDQQAQAKAIWEKEKPSLQPLMQAMHQNHADMRALEAAGPFDEAKTRALATQNSQTMIELQVAHARIKSEMIQILTADQKAKLAAFEAKHADRMSRHSGPPSEE